MPLPAHTACFHWARSAVALEMMDNSNGLIRGRKRRERWKEEIGKNEEMKRKMSIRKGERRDWGEEKDDNRHDLTFLDIPHDCRVVHGAGDDVIWVRWPAEVINIFKMAPITRSSAMPFYNLSIMSCSCTRVRGCEQGYMPTLKDYLVCPLPECFNHGPVLLVANRSLSKQVPSTTNLAQLPNVHCTVCTG